MGTGNLGIAMRTLPPFGAVRRCCRRPQDVTQNWMIGAAADARSCEERKGGAG
jgi:hypothetical protein